MFNFRRSEAYILGYVFYSNTVPISLNLQSGTLQPYLNLRYLEFKTVVNRRLKCAHDIFFYHDQNINNERVGF